MSRKDFCQRHSIPEVTLKSWELSLKSISIKQLEKVIRAFEKEGMCCTQEWILKGTPPSPFARMETLQQTIGRAPQRFLLTPPHQQLQELSLKVFYGIYPQGLHFTVPDDQMAPFFTSGDIVCGVAVESWVPGVPYMVETQENQRIVRLVFTNISPDSLRLQTINPDQKEQDAFQIVIPRQIYHIIMITRPEHQDPFFFQRELPHDPSSTLQIL